MLVLTERGREVRAAVIRAIAELTPFAALTGGELTQLLTLLAKTRTTVLNGR